MTATCDDQHLPRLTLAQTEPSTHDTTVMTVVAALNSYDPLAAIESYPYLIRDEDHFNAVYNGEIGSDLFDALAKSSGLRLVCVWSVLDRVARVKSRPSVRSTRSKI